LADKIHIVHVQGDGVGRDIWDASHEALEEAVIKAYHGEKRIEWINVSAGIEALEKSGKLLPDETVDTVKAHKVAIKGPLTTPVGSGFRSVNVYLRQIFDLYVCLRPVRYFDGLPSPLKDPKNVDFVIIRENMEDLYRGIEWEEGTDDVKDVIGFLRTKTDARIADDSAIGIKPMSRSGTRRFVRWAIEYALTRQRKCITVVHKGNIMKYTEGAFRKWAYEVAREYGDRLALGGESGRIAFNDRIADNMFMQVILRPGEYDVLVCPNLNGDYLSDACAALIGGLGVAPGANIGDEAAIFEPTHGSAPKYAGRDVVNPTSFLLSGVMMFDYLGMGEAALLLKGAVEATIRDGVVTYDLARQMSGVTPVSCSAFGSAVTKRIGA
jgi:isocitrate dehydrogenase